jgi:hypothetical protein
LLESCDNQNLRGPLNRDRAGDLFAGCKAAQVHLPMPFLVDKRAFGYASFLYASLDLWSRNPSLNPALLCVPDDNDIVAVKRKHSHQLESIGVVQFRRLLLGREWPP